MANREIPSGIIDHKWAEQVATDGQFDIWRYNSENAEVIQNDVDLRALGGLVTVFGLAEPVPHSERIEIRYRRTIIDLAFSEPAFGTSTRALLASSEEQLGEDASLTKQLRLRSKPTNLHGGDETWFFPTHAIQLVETTRS